MTVCIENADARSPIFMIHLSDHASLNLTFKKGYLQKEIDLIPGLTEGHGAFRAVWSQGDVVRISTQDKRATKSLSGLYSCPVSEREVNKLILILVQRNLLDKSFQDEMRKDLTRGFAFLRVMSIQEQVQSLLATLIEVKETGRHLYFESAAKHEGLDNLSITEKDYNNLQNSILQLEEVSKIIAKSMSGDFAGFSIHDIRKMSKFEPLCEITCGLPKEIGLIADKKVAHDLQMLLTDFSNYFKKFGKIKSTPIGPASFGFFREKSCSIEAGSPAIIQHPERSRGTSIA